MCPDMRVVAALGVVDANGVRIGHRVRYGRGWHPGNGGGFGRLLVWLADVAWLEAQKETA